MAILVCPKCRSGPSLSGIQTQRPHDDRKHWRHAAVHGSRADHPLSRCHSRRGPILGRGHAVPPADEAAHVGLSEGGRQAIAVGSARASEIDPAASSRSPRHARRHHSQRTGSNSDRTVRQCRGISDRALELPAAGVRGFGDGDISEWGSIDLPVHWVSRHFRFFRLFPLAMALPN